MKIKSKDIAEALGLSTATVSLAINNKPGVNRQTRQEILDYIEKCRQGINAQGTEEQKSAALVLVMDSGTGDDKNGFFQEFYNEIFRVFGESEYSLEVIYFDRACERFEELAERLRKKGAGGIFLWAYRMQDEDFREFENLGIPMVIYDHTHRCVNADNILFNNRAGVEEAVSYLAEQGHEKIVYFAVEEETQNFQRRRKAYREYCRELGIAGRIETVGADAPEIAERVKGYLCGEEEAVRPTAVFAETYQVSIGCILAFRELGLKVPDGISMVCFDELPEVFFLDFEPATVRIFHREKAAFAAKRLIERMESPEEIELEIYVRTEFQKGNSVKRIR